MEAQDIVVGGQYRFQHNSDPNDPDNGAILTVVKIHNDPLTRALAGGQPMFENSGSVSGELGLAFADELSPVD